MKSKKLPCSAHAEECDTCSDAICQCHKMDITEEDVKRVAQNIGIFVNESHLKEIIYAYNEEKKKEPTTTCEVVLENMIYIITRGL